jgi:hypothetical protein
MSGGSSLGVMWVLLMAVTRDGTKVALMVAGLVSLLVGLRAERMDDLRAETTADPMADL